MRRLAVIAALMAACVGRESSLVSSGPKHSRISPGGQGKVVSFDVHSDELTAVRIDSKDVQAQRDHDALIVNFDEVRVRRAVMERRDLDLRKFSVKVYRRGQELVASSEKKLEDQKLTADHPEARLNAIELKVDNAAAACETGCMVTAAIDFAHGAQGGTTQTVPVEITLGTQTGPAPTATVVSKDTGDQQRCDSLSRYRPADASKALGMPMRYAPDCSMVPVTPVQPPFSVSVLDDPNACDAISSTQQGGEPVELGDRAFWFPATSMLCVKKGDRTIRVGVSGAESKSEAMKIAIKVFTHR